MKVFSNFSFILSKNGFPKLFYIHNFFYETPVCYCVQFNTFIEHLQDSVYEKAKRMNSSLDNVAKRL